MIGAQHADAARVDDVGLFLLAFAVPAFAAYHNDIDDPFLRAIADATSLGVVAAPLLVLYASRGGAMWRSATLRTLFVLQLPALALATADLGSGIAHVALNLASLALAGWSLALLRRAERHAAIAST